VALNPPVAVLIAPHIGSPANAPKANTVNAVPNRLPMSCVPPMAMMGDETRAMKHPVQNLRGTLGKFTEMGEGGSPIHRRTYPSINASDINPPFVSMNGQATVNMPAIAIIGIMVFRGPDILYCY
jgi:hypothetical protein